MQSGKRWFFVTVFILLVNCTVSVNSQEFDNIFDLATKREKPTDGEVNISQSNEIYQVINNHVYRLAHLNGITGYRIRIYSNSSNIAREQVNEQKSKFLAKYPDITTHLQYDAPFYKLYVGDFRRKQEALELFTKIKREFPGAFIVSAQVNLPKLD